MLNKLQIIGNLGRDPEVRYLNDGTPVAALSVGVTEKWKDKTSGEKREATEWIRCAVFGQLAEICEKYLAKGSLVYVEGKMATRKYTDKDGVERSVTECKVHEMKMLGGKPAQAQGQEARQQAPAQRQAPPQRQAPAQTSHGGGFDDMPDDVPF